MYSTLIESFFLLFFYLNQWGLDSRENLHTREANPLIWKKNPYMKKAYTSGKKARTHGRIWHTQGLSPRQVRTVTPYYQSKAVPNPNIELALTCMYIAVAKHNPSMGHCPTWAPLLFLCRPPHTTLNELEVPHISS